METNPYVQIRELERDLERVKRSVLSSPLESIANGNVLVRSSSAAGGVSWVDLPRVFMLDSRQADNSGTSTTDQVIIGNGTVATFSSASGALGLVTVDPADYAVPTGYKMQVRGHWSYASYATTGRDWTFSLRYASGINAGVVTTGGTLATATWGGTIGANAGGKVVTAWADLTTTRSLFMTHAALVGVASAAMGLQNRIEARVIAA